MTGNAVTGLFGKIPAHGDFVRRNLPASFVGPWDEWLQSGIAAARGELGESWAASWEAAPAWRFALPAGACGPDPVAGLLLFSRDTVGRLFPLTLAALPVGAQPGESWFAALDALAREARGGSLDADRLADALPLPEGEGAEAPGWWTPDLEWPLPALLPPDEFALLLEVSHP